MTDRRIEHQARKARERQERLLYLKTMELLLGAMIRLLGVTEVRQLLRRYLDDLAEFDAQGDP